jgi:NTP pyrophosphatase (non-canonical NTP hydrolase)
MKTENSLKQIQKLVEDWIKLHGGYWPPLSMLSAVMEELGELSKEINSLEGYKPKKINLKESNLGEELADLVYSIMCIANYYNVDLDEEFEKVMKKYSERDSERFL